MTIVTLGEPLAVCYPTEPIALDGAARLHLDIGGAEANTAIWLRRLGHAVRYLGRVGADPFGRRVRSVLAGFGVDVTELRAVDGARTGVLFREWLPDGARRGYYYRDGSAASEMQPDDLKAPHFVNTQLVHLTGITPALSAGCAATVRRAMELGRAAGALIAFDPNYRAALWPPEQAREQLIPLMRGVDILLIGHEDAQALLGVEAPDAVFTATRALGVATTVFKRSAEGAWADHQGQRAHMPAERVDQVVDPVGAGDAFNAGFLAGWLSGEGLEQSLRQGAGCGAAAVRALGDYRGRLLPEGHES